MKHKICDKCKYDVSLNNFKLHYENCSGLGPHNRRPRQYKRRKLATYDWCKIQESHDFGLSWRELSMKFNISFSALSKGVKENLFHSRNSQESKTLKGTSNKGCISWSKEKLSENAKKHGFGGYRKNAGHSKKEYRLDSMGNEVCLQSSFETRLAIILDELNILWIRPKFINYEMNGINKKYFPDFLLLDYNIYLDPKNNFLIKYEKDKFDAIRKSNPELVVHVISESNIDLDFIKSILK